MNYLWKFNTVKFFKIFNFLMEKALINIQAKHSIGSCSVGIKQTLKSICLFTLLCGQIFTQHWVC